MGHINKDPGDYDVTASAWIVMLDGPEPKLLLHKHKLIGKFLQFGGHKETKENIWQTINHEVKEESGYSLSQLKILQHKIRVLKLTGVVLHPEPVVIISHCMEEGHYHMDTEYVFTATGPPENAIADDESVVLRAFTYNELMDLNDQQSPINTREMGAYILEHCLNDWVPVDPNEFSLKNPRKI